MKEEEPKQNLVNETLKIAGIENIPKQLTKEQVDKIIELSAEHKISTMALDALIQTYPQFIELAIEVTKSAKESQIELIKTVSSSQKASLESISNNLTHLIETLNILATKAKTDKARIKIANTIINIGNLIIEHTKIIQSINDSNNKTNTDINKDNNTFWTWLLSSAMFVLVIITFGLLKAKSKD